MTDFQEVYSLYFREVYRYALSLCRSESVAEEITQETFYKALAKLDSFDGRCKISVWLCQIAKNTYFTWCSQQKKQLPLEQAAWTADTPDIAEIFEEKALAAKAFSCLHALDEPYKEVFLLNTFGGLSLKDISVLFGKSESWARVTYYRAKQKIMEGLGKYEL